MCPGWQIGGVAEQHPALTVMHHGRKRCGHNAHSMTPYILAQFHLLEVVDGQFPTPDLELLTKDLYHNPILHARS